MKKVLVLLALAFIGCTTDNKSTTPTSTTDCNCDKVVEKQTFNIVGTPENPAINYHTVYTTINECTKVQKQKTYTTTNQFLIPKLGECR